MNNNCIVYAIDDNKLQNQCLIASIKYLYKFYNYQIIILSIKENDSQIKKLKKIYQNIITINVDEYLNDMNQYIERSKFQRTDLTSMTYIKLYIPLIFKNLQYKNILYLDNDIKINSNETINNALNQINETTYDILGYSYNPKIELIRIKDSFIKAGLKFNQFYHQEYYIQGGFIGFNIENINNKDYKYILQNFIKFASKLNFHNQDQDSLYFMDKNIKIGSFNNIVVRNVHNIQDINLTCDILHFVKGFKKFFI